MGVAQLWSLLKEADAVSILQGSLLGQHRTIVDEADGLVSPSPQEPGSMAAAQRCRVHAVAQLEGDTVSAPGPV